MRKPRTIAPSERSKQMTKEWQIARTQAHLHINGNYAGITVSLTKCRPSDETLRELNLPPLPKGR
jgi:hypothetical protein